MGAVSPDSGDGWSVWERKEVRRSGVRDQQARVRRDRAAPSGSLNTEEYVRLTCRQRPRRPGVTGANTLAALMLACAGAPVMRVVRVLATARVHRPDSDGRALHRAVMRVTEPRTPKPRQQQGQAERERTAKAR